MSSRDIRPTVYWYQVFLNIYMYIYTYTALATYIRYMAAVDGVF